jgi:hypothetical protein
MHHLHKAREGLSLTALFCRQKPGLKNISASTFAIPRRERPSLTSSAEKAVDA